MAKERAFVLSASCRASHGLLCYNRGHEAVFSTECSKGDEAKILSGQANQGPLELDLYGHSAQWPQLSITEVSYVFSIKIDGVSICCNSKGCYNTTKVVSSLAIFSYCITNLSTRKSKALTFKGQKQREGRSLSPKVFSRKLLF